MTLDTDFWTMFAFGLIGLIVISIVVAALWSYIFKDQ